jgi:hypothetical protein
MNFTSLPDMMSNIELFIKENPIEPLEHNDEPRNLIVGFKAVVNGTEYSWSIRVADLKRDRVNLTERQNQILTDLLDWQK